METEAFFSGYCRQLDAARTVAVVAENGTLTDADCLYENCPHAPSCPVAEKIDGFIKKQ